MLRAAIYARVSTPHQRLDNQLVELRAYAERRGWDVVAELAETVSGSRDDRPRHAELMALARSRRVDVVLVWKFDRFARSLRQLVMAADEFRVLGVDFVSVTESIDTTTPGGRLAFGVFAAVAEFERELIRERVTAGLRRAQARGVRLGRPTLHADLVNRIREQRAAGRSARAVARDLRVARGTVARYAR